jgi:hypothetical protein
MAIGFETGKAVRDGTTRFWCESTVRSLNDTVCAKRTCLAQFEDSVEPTVLAVVPLPSPEERRRREVLLARLMILMTDHILAGDPLETARDLLRELQHTYPEIVDRNPK